MGAYKCIGPIKTRYPSTFPYGSRIKIIKNYSGSTFYEYPVLYRSISLPQLRNLKIGEHILGVEPPDLFLICGLILQKTIPETENRSFVYRVHKSGALRSHLQSTDQWVRQDFEQNAVNMFPSSQPPDFMFFLAGQAIRGRPSGVI